LLIAYFGLGFGRFITPGNPSRKEGILIIGIWFRARLRQYTLEQIWHYF
jgi:hypothetical protein